MKNFGNNAWLAVMNIVYTIHSKESIEEVAQLVLRQIQWLVPYDHAMFLLPKEDNAIEIIASANLKKEYLDLYEEKYLNFDHASGLKIGGSSIVFRHSDIIEKNVYENSSFYNQFCKPNNIYYGMHVILIYDSKFCGEIILFRDKDSINGVEFGENAEFVLNLIKEHLSLGIHRLSVENDQEKTKSSFYDEDYVSRAIRPYELTKREKEIVYMILTGKTNEDICDTLIISINTLKKHIVNIYKKMGVKSRIQLIQTVQSDEMKQIV